MTSYARIYSFNEIERIHRESAGELLNFNQDLKRRCFKLTMVKMDDILLDSSNSYEVYIKLAEYQHDIVVINNLISALRKGDKLPPVILLQMADGKYDIRDGLHRTIARKVLGINEFDAFVALPENMALPPL